MAPTRERSELTALLSTAGIGTWRWEPATGAVHWDATTEGLYGLDQGGFDGSFEAYMALVHPDDRADAAELIGSLAERGGDYSIRHRIVQPTGAVRWIEGQGRIVVENGVALAGFGIVYDVTDRSTLEEERDQLRISERAERAARTATEQDLATLIEASDALAGALNVTKVVERICTLLVPTLADAVTVDVRLGDAQGSVMTGRQQRDSHKPRIAKAIPSDEANERLGLPSGKVDEETADRLCVGPGQVTATNTIASVIAITARGTRIGTVLVERFDGRWTARSDSLIKAICRRAAVALDNAELYQEQATVSALLSRSVSPDHVEGSPHFDLATHYQAATQMSRLGGDFYDFFEVGPSTWMAVIGDLTGKGIAAAARAGLTRSAVRAAGLVTADAKATVEAVNRIMRTDPERPLATLIVATLEFTDGEHRFTVASAGHPPALLARESGNVDHADTRGMLLGFADDPGLSTCSGILRIGESLVVYSDGATEARLGGEMYGDERLATTVGMVADAGANAIARAIAASIDGWTAGPLQDDITVIVVTAT